MKTRSFLLTLQDDVVVSESAATTGGHRCLDYIPGSAMLGAAAARVYNDPGLDSWLLFHSGKVRFGNARPLGDDRLPTIPLPLSLYQEKGSLLGAGMEPAGLFNLAAVQATELENEKQLKQLRGGFVSLAGQRVRAKHVSRLKTAIDPATGRASEGQLFGYESLLSGQQFLGWIDWDDDVPADQLDRLIQVLNGRLRIGRSRSAQYGEVQCAPLDFQPQFPSDVIDDRVILLALSDLALCDTLYQPTLIPEPASLGLANLELDARFTHLRVRRYSPYNAWRRSHESERQVIAAGSVLCYRKLPGFDENTLAALNAGVGRYRESGLGRIWCQPSVLAARHPVFPPSAKLVPVTMNNSTADAPIAKPATALIHWLSLRADAGGQRQHDERILSRIVAQLPELYRSARQVLGGVEGEKVGPGRSQWGEIDSQAMRRSGKALHEGLFGTETIAGAGGKVTDDRKIDDRKQSHLCKRRDPDWGAETYIDGKAQTFREWLLDVVMNSGIKDTSYFLRKLADAVRSETVMKICEGREGSR
ncbi:MAG: hypothetical protein IPM37_15670 [Hahellaceae bacterium]|nr:hypothetical protein [Hahellaceae bacterium]